MTGHQSARRGSRCSSSPEGPSTQCLRTPVPNTIKGVVFGTRVLKYWVLAPSGQGRAKYFWVAPGRWEAMNLKSPGAISVQKAPLPGPKYMGGCQNYGPVLGRLNT